VEFVDSGVVLWREKLDIYLSPLPPVPCRTSELVTVSNINRFLRVIAIFIVDHDAIIIHRRRLDATNGANLLSSFARHGAFAPASGLPLVSRHGGSGLDVVNVVIKYRRRVIGDSWCCVPISGCRNICNRCFLSLIEETKPMKTIIN
jgi:hypothetical protein